MEGGMVLMTSAYKKARKVNTAKQQIYEQERGYINCLPLIN